MVRLHSLSVTTLIDTSTHYHPIFPVYHSIRGGGGAQTLVGPKRATVCLEETLILVEKGIRTSETNTDRSNKEKIPRDRTDSPLSSSYTPINRLSDPLIASHRLPSVQPPPPRKKQSRAPVRYRVVNLFYFSHDQRQCSCQSAESVSCQKAAPKLRLTRRPLPPLFGAPGTARLEY